MHTRPLRRPTAAAPARPGINVITLGCSKNRVDSEVLLTQLAAAGVQATHEDDATQAGTVVINTCGFIDNAKEESVNTILDWVSAKQAGVVDRVIVTGCLSERYRQDLQSEIPEVDAWFGTQQDLPNLLEALGANYRHELLGERQTTTDAHYAYLKISEGCDRPCAFCAIPLMRGGHRSRTIESLVDEARFLAARGVRELLLIAQDSTYYGLDLYGERRLAELLRALAQIDGLRWIRLHYAFPSGFPTDILPVMAQEPKIARYLDMPLQHASTALLKRMRRGSGRPQLESLIQQIRQTVPGIALRTTFIVGFPGETEADHQELLDFLRQQRFDRVGVFTYSHEENTHAFQYQDDVPADTKARRRDEVMALQQEISLELNRARVGQTLPVVIDRQEGHWFIGRSEFDSPEVDNEVLITPAPGQTLRIGEFYSIRITDATEYDLMGEV